MTDGIQSYIPVKNGQLFTLTFGKSGKPFVVVHGGPGLGCHYLLPQMQELGKFSFAIFYDQRGAGNSTSTSDWQSQPFQTYCDDIEDLRKNFGFEKISLLAHSYGGIFASMYALKFPQHVEKLIYLNSVPLSSDDYLEFVKHRSSIVDENKNQLDELRNSEDFLHGDPNTVEQYYRIYFRNYFAKPDLADTLSLNMSRIAAINNFHIYNYFFDYVKKHPFNLYEKLGQLNLSTLILAGDKDVIPLHYTEKLHASLPSSIYKVIKNCGHFSYIDQPEIVFKTIKSFTIK